MGLDISDVEKPASATRILVTDISTITLMFPRFMQHTQRRHRNENVILKIKKLST
jgi:hypothetical protein